MDELPSGRNPHPGTVSNVMIPQPMRTGSVDRDSAGRGSAEKTVVGINVEAAKAIPQIASDRNECLAQRRPTRSVLISSPFGNFSRGFVNE